MSGEKNFIVISGKKMNKMYVGEKFWILLGVIQNV